jgi:hypothetical protein
MKRIFGWTRLELPLAAWLAGLLSLLGGGAYFLQAVSYAHSMASMVDEAAYLYKGYLFLTGQYTPFEDYGPWTNKAPLSFLIFGVIQRWFGLGLRSGRYFAILAGLLMLLGLWLAARRMGGRWWAALAVWAVAINPWGVKEYTLAGTQVLIACLLTWIMVLALGTKRPLWQLILAGALSGIVVMIRQNLLPVAPLLILYTFWQHGRKAGWWAAAAAAAVLIGIHALYWPNILQLWTPWLPRSLTPFLDAWRTPAGAATVAGEDIDLLGRLFVFFQGYRYHFIAMTGATLVLLFWARRKKWKSEPDFRAAVFVLALLGVLWLAHAWASLGMNVCIFCYPEYISFFAPVELLLLAISFRCWERGPAGLRTAALLLLILLLATGLGYSVYEDLSLKDTIEAVLDALVPRMRHFQFLPGSVPFWMVLGNKYGWSYLESYEVFRRLIPAAAGLGVGILLVLLAVTLHHAILKRLPGLKPSFAFSAALLFLLAGTLLSPSLFLGGGSFVYDCGEGTLAAYEAAGAQAARLVPPGSRVYWDIGSSGSSVAPLMLYLPKAQVFPPQLNGLFGFRIGGDADELYRLGRWNAELAARWMPEADVIIIQRPAIYSLWEAYVSLPGYEEHRIQRPLGPCMRTDLRVILRQP